MELEVQRSGGFAGRVVRWSVVLEELPAELGAQLQELLTGPEPAPSPGADRFSWRLTGRADEGEQERVFGEPPPEPVQRLVDLVPPVGR